MAVAYVSPRTRSTQSRRRPRRRSQQADALEAQAAQLGTFTDFASIKDQRLASVVTTAQTRFDWERFMRELSRVMPEGSWLQTTQASVPGDADAAARRDASAAVPEPVRDARGLHAGPVRGGHDDGGWSSSTA